MNILVTGGAGFIGSWIAEAYLQQGHQVVVVDDLSVGRRQNVPPGAILVEMDVQSERLHDLFATFRFDVVNHHAARADVRESIEKPQLYVDVNIKGGINLLECCRAFPVKSFLFASSGGCAYGDTQVIPTDETNPVQPKDPYGTSKMCLELYIKMYGALYGIPYTIFRYPNIYGPRQNPFGEAGVVGIFVQSVLQNKPVIIYGDGLQSRDFVYVDDVVAANVQATTLCRNATYNLGHGNGITVVQILELLRTMTGYSLPEVYRPARAGEIQHSVLSSDLVRRELSWRPDVEFEDGLRKTLEYIKQFEIIC